MMIKSEIILERLRDALKSADRNKSTDTEVTQYHITINGKVVKDYVLNMKEFTITEGTNSDAEIDITIDDDDMMRLFQNKIQLVELHAQRKIAVKGNVELLKVLDKRRAATLRHQ